MKNKKWLTYTLGILLTLVVLAVVAGVSFRAGMMQNASFTRPSFAHNFDGDPQVMQRYFHDNGGPQAMQGNFHDNGRPQTMPGNYQVQGFDNRGNDRSGDRRGGMSFFSPIFGLIRLAVLGLLLWIGYKLVQKSGWRLTRVASPVVAAGETASVKKKKN